MKKLITLTFFSILFWIGGLDYSSARGILRSPALREERSEEAQYLMRLYRYVSEHEQYWIANPIEEENRSNWFVKGEFDYPGITDDDIVYIEDHGTESIHDTTYVRLPYGETTLYNRRGSYRDNGKSEAKSSPSEIKVQDLRKLENRLSH